MHRDGQPMEINPDNNRVKKTPATIGDVAAAVETWAPLALAESYDNPGLQVGDPTRAVSKVLIALDMTPQVLDEAVRLGCNLIVTHHPLIFQPISAITPSSYVSNLCLRLAEEKIGLYSAHTNLDSARGGVSFALAEQLGLENIRFLMDKKDAVVKLVIFVPENAAASIRDALTAAGAGKIGKYSGCLFSSRGAGQFTPDEGSDPVVGSAGGGQETVDEVRIETEVARWDLPTVLTAARKAHPYDEMAYDVYPVEQPFRDAGIGAVGVLKVRQKLGDFLRRVSLTLDNPALRYVGNLNDEIQKVAVCGGSGSRYLGAAIKQGVDAYVTADITYHHFFEALDNTDHPKIALIDPGHYETEQITEKLLADFLSEEFPDLEWLQTNTKTSPVKSFVRDFHTDSSHAEG